VRSALGLALLYHNGQKEASPWFAYMELLTEVLRNASHPLLLGKRALKGGCPRLVQAVRSPGATADLEGTDASPAADDAELRMVFEGFVLPFVKEHAASFPEEVARALAAPTYRRLQFVMLSRAVEATEGGLALVPLLDLFNSAGPVEEANQAGFVWHEDGSVSVVAERAVTAGQQVFMRYCEEKILGNSQLMRRYGFALKGPLDKALLSAPDPAGDAGRWRAWWKNISSNPRDGVLLPLDCLITGAEAAVADFSEEAAERADEMETVGAFLSADAVPEGEDEWARFCACACGVPQLMADLFAPRGGQLPRWEVARTAALACSIRLSEYATNLEQDVEALRSASPAAAQRLIVAAVEKAVLTRLVALAARVQAPPEHEKQKPAKMRRPNPAGEDE
jgi:hypothetical protein